MEDYNIYLFRFKEIIHSFSYSVNSKRNNKYRNQQYYVLIMCECFLLKFLFIKLIFFFLL